MKTINIAFLTVGIIKGLNKINNSFRELIPDLERAPSTTKSELANSNNGVREEDVFLKDVFMEKLFFDATSIVIEWLGGRHTTESLDYFLDFFYSGDITYNQKKTIRVILSHDNFFYVNFILPCVDFIRQATGIGHGEKTWDIISTEIKKNTLIVYNLGDWRVDEYMRLLKEGKLRGIYAEEDNKDAQQLEDYIKESNEPFEVKKDDTFDKLKKYTTFLNVVKDAIATGDISKVLALGLVFKKGKKVIPNEEAIMDYVVRSVDSSDFDFDSELPTNPIYKVDAKPKNALINVDKHITDMAKKKKQKESVPSDACPDDIPPWIVEDE